MTSGHRGRSQSIYCREGRPCVNGTLSSWPLLESSLEEILKCNHIKGCNQSKCRCICSQLLTCLSFLEMSSWRRSAPPYRRNFDACAAGDNRSIAARGIIKVARVPISNRRHEQVYIKPALLLSISAQVEVNGISGVAREICPWCVFRKSKLLAKEKNISVISQVLPYKEMKYPIS